MKILNKLGYVLKEVPGDTMSGADLSGANLCWATAAEAEAAFAAFKVARGSRA